MYLPGTRIEVKVKIDLPANDKIEPGTKGTVLGTVKKMVGIAYKIKLDDDREVDIHIVIMKNQTEIIED